VKNRIKNTALYTIAFLLFFFGNSVNVIHFCCDVCRAHGSQIFTERICHEKISVDKLLKSDLPNLQTHDDAFCNHGQEGNCVSHLTHQHEICSLDRISITLDNFHWNFKTKLLILAAFLFGTGFLGAFFARTTSDISFPFYSYAIPLAGRQLLNKICVLRN
jgi:hypothetical protein